VQLKNDECGWNNLKDTILNHYNKIGMPINFSGSSREEGWLFHYYLIDKKHVIQYGIGEDRHVMLGGLALGIGPRYFGPSEFWDYENSERFSMEASTEAVEKNLNLLDEFLGKR
jgi:hypothetical protein